jgi:aspartyl-tRNA(Asn)/glutamyl-tRNA(Gln) amidotransferase subunit C
MASQVTRADAARIAALARLELSEAELDLLAGQLADIVNYAAVVQQVDTTSVEGADSAGPHAPLRKDVPAPWSERDDAIRQAPDVDPATGLIRVPKVV